MPQAKHKFWSKPNFLKVWFLLLFELISICKEIKCCHNKYNNMALFGIPSYPSQYTRMLIPVIDTLYKVVLVWFTDIHLGHQLPPLNIRRCFNDTFFYWGHIDSKEAKCLIGSIADGLDVWDRPNIRVIINIL
jgi:hypothetical protein